IRDFNVPLDPTENRRDGIAAVLRGNLVIRSCLIDGFAALHLRLHPRQELVIKIRVLLQVGKRHEWTMTRDDCIDILDAFSGLRYRLAILDGAAAIVTVDEWCTLAGERVSRVHRA